MSLSGAQAGAITVLLVRPFPLDAFGITPQRLEVVVRTSVGFEEVDDQINKVGDQPGGSFVGRCADDGHVSFFGEIFDVLKHRVHLAIGCAGADENVVGDLRDASNVEQDDVVTFVIANESSGVDGESARVRGIGFDRSVLCGGHCEEGREQKHGQSVSADESGMCARLRFTKRFSWNQGREIVPGPMGMKPVGSFQCARVR